MRGSVRRGQGCWLVLLALGSLPGCQDVGLAGRNTPEEEAAASAFRYLVYDVAPVAAGQEVVTEITPASPAGAGAAPTRSQHWLMSAEMATIPERLLRPIGGTGGSMLYALAWDDPPYERVYAAGSEPGVYHPLHAVPPVATRTEAADAGEHGTGH